MEPIYCISPEFRDQYRKVLITIEDTYRALKVLGLKNDQEYQLVKSTLRACRECIDSHYELTVKGDGNENKNPG
jgi:hypothetical protein